ncbi:hypothetical protein [Pseudoalteromonas sp. NZS127_1]|nr:hypothetical protein [Pseudoalteromonas sp. NZS127_1]
MKMIHKLTILLCLVLMSVYTFADELKSPTRTLDGTSITYNYTSG